MIVKETEQATIGKLLPTARYVDVERTCQILLSRPCIAIVIEVRSVITMATQIDEPREWIAATVAHCTQGVGRFLIGVRFDAPVPTD